jgi:hypothetical protein
MNKVQRKKIPAPPYVARALFVWIHRVNKTRGDRIAKLFKCYKKTVVNVKQSNTTEE